MNQVYVLESTSSFLIDKKIKEIKEKENIKKEEVSQYDLSEHTLEQVLEDLDTYSFLSSRKCIIVENALFLSASADGLKIEEDVLKHFENYLDHPNPDYILILVVPKLDDRKKLTKKLKKIASVLSLEEDATSYIKSNLSDYKIDFASISLLVEYCREDINKLHQEIEKLKLFCLDSKTITKEDIKALVEPSLDDSDTYVFSFVNTLISKNKKESLIIYHNLLKLGLDPIAIVALVANQFRLIYQVKVLTKEGKSKDMIAKHLECHPYRVEKAKISGFSYQEVELLGYLQKLADLDLKMKTGQVTSEDALEMFILEM